MMMEREKRLFEPGDMVATFTGQAGMVIAEETYATIRKRLKEGKRPGHYFAPGCCQNPDYVTQVPVLFEDKTWDVMRAMGIRRDTSLSREKRSHIQNMIKEETMEECIFCKIIKGEIPSFKIYEDDKVFAFEDINPISEGHTLLIPKIHARDLWEIPGEDLAAVHLASKKIIQAIKKVLNPTGVACLQLNGQGVNQVVMHYHLHLIPRTAGAPEIPVAAWELKEGDMESIKKTAEKIAEAVK